MWESIFYGLLAFAIWVGLLTVERTTVALIGTYFGFRVKEIKICVGRVVFQRYVGNCRVRFGWLPIGGYTLFANKNESPPWQEEHELEDDPNPENRAFYKHPFSGAFTWLSGGIFFACISFFLLGLPVWIGSPQLEVCQPQESIVRHCGVGGLRFREESSSWESQFLLFRETGIEFAIRLVTFRADNNWGGLVAFFVTTGQISSHSFGALFSCLGVLFLCATLVAFIPLPPFPLFMSLQVLCREIIEFDIPTSVAVAIYLPGFIGMLFFHFRALWIDLKWFWFVFFG